jgi:hypothetical protein
MKNNSCIVLSIQAKQWLCQIVKAHCDGERGLRSRTETVHKPYADDHTGAKATFGGWRYNHANFSTEGTPYDGEIASA